MKRVIICLFLICSSSYADINQGQIITPYNEINYEKNFKKIYAQLHEKDIATRIVIASNYFINKPYALNPLGEGPKGRYDQNPLFRDDAFDCQTFVETVLAIAYSKDITSFKHHLLAIRYTDGNPDFEKRNHFMNVDWNKNNSHKGYLQDITYKITDPSGQPIAAIADTIIDKPSWYNHLDKSQIKQFSFSNKNLLEELRQLSREMQREKSVILYIPLTQLFDQQKNPRLEIFKKIPNASIIEIVRSNWSLKKMIGTDLDVSHLGFAIRTNKGLMYREASSISKKVMDIPLTTYLSQYMDSKTVKGINVQLTF